jgi:5-methylcytosine-specific restriction endonuclease McrA
MGLLFEKQPEWCRQKLDAAMVKNFDKLHENLKRLVLFDPTEAYNRIDAANAIDPFRRYNSVSIGLLFPKAKEKVCSCGCGTNLTGRQTVWAGKECTKLPLNVQTVISGHSHLLSLCRGIFGSECVVCGISESDSGHTHELDHKYPVKFGGAGGWLSNYEFKCKKCHRDKTNNDFGFGKYKPEIIQQPTLFDVRLEKNI